MAELRDVPWPPAPIRTERLVLRRTSAADRSSFVELRCSAEVYRYLGGPAPRDRVEREVPAVPGDRVGVFAVELEGAVIGAVSIGRRDLGRPGERDGALELSYLLLPAYWSQGYATEAATAVLGWVDDVLPAEPVVLCTQAANDASVRLAGRLGFEETERFVEFGAEQWLGVRAQSGVDRQRRRHSGASQLSIE